MKTTESLVIPSLQAPQRRCPAAIRLMNSGTDPGKPVNEDFSKIEPNIVIRDERPEDGDSVEQLTAAAFAGVEYSDGTEHEVVGRLRAAGALTVSLVAEMNGDIVGHVAVSPVRISGGVRNWHGLGPVSVRPAYQRRGVGSALITRALSRLREHGAGGCVVLGDPGYYSRFGFERASHLIFPDAPSEYFMARSFVGPFPAGTVSYHEAFTAET